MDKRLTKSLLFFIFIIWTYPLHAQETQLQQEETTCTFEESMSGFFDISNFAAPVCDLLAGKMDALWHEGRYDDIFPYIFLLTRLDNKDVQSWALGGWFLIYALGPGKKGKENYYFEKGVSFLKEGITNVPDSYRLYWELGWTYSRKNMPEKALGELDESIKYPHPFYVENTRAHVLMDLGRNEEALKQWQEILKKYPEGKNIAETFIKKIENDTSENH